MTTATATLALTQLEVDVFSLDAAVARARLQMQRNRAIIRLGYHSYRGRQCFRRVETQLGSVIDGLNDRQLRQISTLLRAPLEPFRPQLQSVALKRNQLRSPERTVVDWLFALVSDIDQLADHVERQAAMTPRKLLYPKLDARHHADARLVSALLPMVRRDSAESDPDPDYGL